MIELNCNILNKYLFVLFIINKKWLIVCRGLSEMKALLSKMDNDPPKEEWVDSLEEEDFRVNSRGEKEKFVESYVIFAVDFQQSKFRFSLPFCVKQENCKN